MIHRRNRAGFAEKLLQFRFFALGRFGQNFDGHPAFHPDMFGQINHAHATFAQVAQQFVFAQEKGFRLPLVQPLPMPRGNQPLAQQKLVKLQVLVSCF